MRFTEMPAPKRRRTPIGSVVHGGLRSVVFTLLALGACSGPVRDRPAPVVIAPPAKPAASTAPKAEVPVLKPAGRATSWAQFRVDAARRLVAANPDSSFTGDVPEPLLAIPVLEVELNGDGSVRRILVLRRPSQALDTLQLAIDAVRRAEPFGDVSKLPRPWKFTETFLFDDDRRFKPRSLD